MSLLKNPTRLVSALLLTSTLTACMVGPNYSGPPTVATGAEGGAPFRRIGDLPVQPLAADAAWWQAFGDPALDRLIEQALQTSPSIAIAKARLRRSRAMVRQNEADLLPSGNASAGYLRYRLPLSGLGVTNDPAGGNGAAQGGTASQSDDNSGGLWSATFDATWEIDLFGGRRRQRDASRAQAEAAEAQLADAQVSLAAEVSQAYIDLRDHQQSLILARRSSLLEQRSLALTEQLFRQGASSREDVERLRTQYSQTKSQETPLSAQVEQSLNRLAVLIGREPGFVDADLAAPKAVPHVPARVPVDDPAAALRRRPDIRAAERQIAASSAQIGVSTAQLFPSVTLLGLIGLGGPSLGDLSFDNYTAVGTPMLRWNFLNFGRVRAQIRQAEAGRDESLAQYQQTVLQALQDAEDSLAQFRGQRGALQSRIEGVRAATTAAEMVRQRQARGAASVIDLLDSERQRVNAEQQLAQAYAQLANGYVAIAKSMGLGWRLPAAAVGTPSAASTDRSR